MKLSDFEKELVRLARAGISIELISPPGLGKSATVEAAVPLLSRLDDEEWGYASLFLATQTPPDLIGYQFKGEVEYDGKKFSITDPTMPSWFQCADGKPVFAYRKGILFLDEFGQGQTDVKAAAAELLLNKRIGKWRLPDGWIVIAASNRTSDRSGVTKSLDFVINRRVEIEIQPDLQSWLGWARKSGISHTTMAFAETNPQVVFEGNVPEKQGPWCTPRSLVMADRLIQTLSGRDMDPEAPLRTDETMTEILCGMIGAPATGQYMVMLKLASEMPPYEDIVKDPSKVKVPENPGAKMLICYELAHKVKPEHMDAVKTYVERLPKDFTVTFAKTAVTRAPTLIATPAMRKWCTENASLLAALNS